MKVRIKVTPKEREIDGVSLKGFHPGAVREVSPLVGSWLIAEEYADAEMRQPPAEEELGRPSRSIRFPSSAHDRRRRKP